MENIENIKILAALSTQFDTRELSRMPGPGYTLKVIPEPDRIFPAALEFQPHIIILPGSEPGWDMHHLCGCLKNNYATASIPVLALVDRREKELFTALYTAGVNDILQLPLIESEWAGRIYQLVELARVRELAYPLDELTGVLKRNAFLQKAQEELIRNKRAKNNLVVAAFQVDQLETIENSAGPEAADKVFVEIISEMKRQLRDTDLIGRLEKRKIFVLLIETSRLEGILVSDRIREKIMTMTFDTGEQSVSATVSVGFTPVNKQDAVIEKVLERAGAALHNACVSGNDSVEIE